MNEFKGSCLTQEQWCDANHEKISTLRYWIAKFKNEASEEEQPEWLSVSVNGNIAKAEVSKKAESVPVTIRIGSFAIDLDPASLHAESLKPLLKALSETC